MHCTNAGVQILCIILRKVVVLLRVIHVFILRLLSAQSLQLSHHTIGGMLTASLTRFAGLQAGRRNRHRFQLMQPATLLPQDTVDVFIGFVLLVYGRQQGRGGTGALATTLAAPQVAALPMQACGLRGWLWGVIITLLLSSLLPSHLASPLLGGCCTGLLDAP